jgi:alpha-1,2-mannosyltransferase
VILAGVPFYWMLNKDSAAANFEIWVGGVSASFFTAVAGLLIYLGMRPNVGERSAFVAACALLFATPIWSVSADALWTQNLTILAIAGAIYTVVHRRWWATGVFFAIGIFARAHFAVVAAVVGLYLGWRRRDWRITIHIGLSSAWGIVLLAIWNRMVYGSWSLRGGYGEYVTANILGDSSLFYEFANVAGFLLAPGRGILIWTPVILLLLPAMLAFWRDLPDWVRGFVFAGIAYSAVQLRINYFLGGAGFFGYRLALELLVCIAPALIYAYKTTATPTRYLIGGIVGLQFAAISIGASTDGYDLTDANVWTTNAYVVALMDQPWLYGLVTGTCAVAGMLITGLALRRTQDRQPIEV